MSRSRKGTPVVGNVGAASDRPGKRLANRGSRRQVSQVILHSIAAGDWDTEDLYIDDRERCAANDRWAFPKDGKHWVTNDVERMVRK